MTLNSLSLFLSVSHYSNIRNGIVTMLVREKREKRVIRM